jgi:hypothetical protein
MLPLDDRIINFVIHRLMEVEDGNETKRIQGSQLLYLFIMY